LSDRNLAVPFASALDGIQFGDSQFALDSPASSARCAVDRWAERFSRYSKPESHARTAAASLPSPSLPWWPRG